MAKYKRTWIFLAGLALGVCGLAQLGDDEGDNAEERRSRAEAAVNQVWVARMPESRRDLIPWFVLVRHPETNIGGFGRSSQWRHNAELFKWSLQGRRLHLVLPQQRTRATLQVRAWQCQGEAPEPFDLCLELAAGERKAIFYSRRDWVIRPGDIQGSWADIIEDAPELARMLPDGELAQIAAEPGDAPADVDDENAFEQVDGLSVLP